MRPAGTTVVDYPMTISYGRAGSCTTCTARVDRGTATPTNQSHLRGGALIELVRWHPTRDGWAYDHVRGLYRGRDNSNYRVIVNGIETLLPRGEWEVCAA
jgi:hypothetical protein